MAVFRLQQQPHVDRRQRRMLESCVSLDVIGARRPREIVDILLVVLVRRRALGIVLARPFDPGRADNPSLRHGERDVIHAVVGEEFGGRVELMTVPALVLEHAQLREPLSDEEIIADHAGASDRPRHVGRPGELNRCGGAGRNRLGERDRHDGLIVGIAIVRRDDVHGPGEIRTRGRGEPERGDVDARTVLGRRRLGRAGAAECALAHEGGPIVLPGIPVQMQLEVDGRARRDISPRDHFRAGDGAGCRIQLRRNRVVRIARRERLRVSG